MNTLREPRSGEMVRDVTVDDLSLSVDLMDGRTIIVPLMWFPRLRKGTPEQRGRWEPAGGGFGIHWPDLDEDISVAGLLDGRPAVSKRAS